MTQWIKCSERLPINHEDVLAIGNEMVPVVAYLRMTGDWNDSENHCNLDWEPTHWMPLPPPPEDEA